jgi:hypothetical protein
MKDNRLHEGSNAGIANYQFVAGKRGVLGKNGPGGRGDGLDARAGKGEPEHPFPRPEGRGFRGISGRLVKEKICASAKKQKNYKKDSRSKALIHLVPLYFVTVKYRVLV